MSKSFTSVRMDVQQKEKKKLTQIASSVFRYYGTAVPTENIKLPGIICELTINLLLARDVGINFGGTVLFRKLQKTILLNNRYRARMVNFYSNLLALNNVYYPKANMFF